MIGQLLDNIAEKAILVEIDDLPTLGELHGLFEELSMKYQEVKDSKSSQCSESNIKRLVDIMLGDTKDPAKELEKIKKDITKLQKNIHKSVQNENKDNDPVELFLETAKDKVRQIEELAIALEKENDSDKTDKLLGLIHSLKGESGILGYGEINEVCHSLESIIQNDQLEQIPARILDFCDWLQKGIENPDAHQSAEGNPEVFIQQLQKLEYSSEQDDIKTIAQELPVHDLGLTALTQDASFYTDFANEAKEHIESAEQILLEMDPNQAESPTESINTIFRSFHTIKGVSSFLDLADLQLLTHRAENVFDQIRSQKLAMSSEIHDLCFKVLDKVKELVRVMENCAKSGQSIPKDPSIPNYVQQLDAVMAGEFTPAPLSLNFGGRQTSSSPETSESTSSSAKVNNEVNTIKVNTDRLDKVINLVGELVISHSMICEELDSNLSKTLLTNMSHMKKNVNELQSLAMSLRMVPIKNTFLKMSRIVRDLSKKMNKKIEFTMEGEDTELDRNMVEQLGDPLVHMVRNSADHGVESEEIRVKAGKNPIGKVCLRAFHKGGNIVIQIQDDGKGIDKEVIYNKAIEKGLVQKNQELSENEIFQLIFAAGFSTAEKVTDVSGRGVGMDVVRRNIENLRGRIEISSEKGHGSTFSIHLPLTLAIIDGMIVRVGTNRFILPTINIDQTSGIKPDGIFSVQNQGKMIKFRDRMVPLIQFDQIFNDPYYHCNGDIMIVLSAGEKHIAIIVDEIITQQEVVIKSLGESLKNIKGLAGSAILPDGNVGIILDPLEITEMFRKTP
jgi:two-component system, chemotaxis family, sensor kinase CheA